MAACLEPFFTCYCLAVIGGTYKLILYYETNLVRDVLYLCMFLVKFTSPYLCLTFGPAPVTPEGAFLAKLDPVQAKLSEVSVWGS